MFSFSFPQIYFVIPLLNSWFGFMIFKIISSLNLIHSHRPSLVGLMCHRHPRRHHHSLFIPFYFRAFPRKRICDDKSPVYFSWHFPVAIYDKFLSYKDKRTYFFGSQKQKLAPGWQAFFLPWRNQSHTHTQKNGKMK